MTTLRRFGTDEHAGILHVDMDAFFVSVEVRRDPTLRGKPVIVGGVGGRGVVTSASYEARAFGVRSAMPGAQARRLCPHGIYLPGDIGAYRAASREVMALLSTLTPLVEQVSVDEAFLDVTGARALFGGPEMIAVDIATRIREQLRLPCSVGVAPNKFLAKLGSQRAKPAGILVIGAGHEQEFLYPLPVQALWGVGESTWRRLAGLGVRTVADLAGLPESAVRRAIGVGSAAHLLRLAAGVDDRRVTPQRVEKSIGAEETFHTDLTGTADIRRELLRLAGTVARRLRRSDALSRTIAIKVRFGDFTTLSRSRTRPAATWLARDIFATAWELYEALRLDAPQIRLLGIRAEGLVKAHAAGHQLSLGDGPGRWLAAEEAVAEVAARFAGAAPRPATLVDTPQSTPSSREPDESPEMLGER